MRYMVLVLVLLLAVGCGLSRETSQALSGALGVGEIILGVVTGDVGIAVSGATALGVIALEGGDGSAPPAPTSPDR